MSHRDTAVPWGQSDDTNTVGKLSARMFPEGIRVIFVGSTYVAAKPESMDDRYLDIAFPYKGDGMYRVRPLWICSALFRTPLTM